MPRLDTGHVLTLGADIVGSGPKLHIMVMKFTLLFCLYNIYHPGNRKCFTLMLNYSYVMAVPNIKYIQSIADYGVGV